MVSTTAPPTPAATTVTDKIIYHLSRRWILVFTLFYGLYVGLPFLAPVLMQMGWDSLANVIYTIYSFTCHQMAQRSFFLYGPKGMVTLSEIQAIWSHDFDVRQLGRFIGTPQMGWKVAWSDRMVWMYTSILFFGWIWYPLRRKVKPPPFWGFLLTILPMALDGTTHFISDLAGIGQGFRSTNQWLAVLTNNTFPPTFYAGDAPGSFNFWMRFLSGCLFGLGIVWLGFPYLEEAIADTINTYKSKLQPPEITK